MNDEIKRMLNPQPYPFEADAVDVEDFEALKRGFLKLMDQRDGLCEVIGKGRPAYALTMLNEDVLEAMRGGGTDGE